MGEMGDQIDFYVLPEGCITKILSFTTPRDACRLSLVSSIFSSASESDALWEKFLPPDYRTIVSRSTSSSPSVGSSTKKQLFFALCDHPLLIDADRKSFSLDKWSGKKCYMLAARDLVIGRADFHQHWIWTSLPDSRFSEVAELKFVGWLEIRGMINVCMLSPATSYAVYFIFKMTTKAFGFIGPPVGVSVGIVGGEIYTRFVYLDQELHERERDECRSWEYSPFPKERSDGWWEIELGEFLNEGVQDGELQMSVMEMMGGNLKSGLVVQGIEIRPKLPNLEW